MIYYCLGLNIWNNQVLLRLKNKPDWQKGRLNGIGGKLEGRETYEQAMVREFQEETGVETKETDWKPLCFMERANTFCTQVFVRLGPLTTIKWRDGEEENVYVEIEKLYNMSSDRLLGNIKWLVAMSQDPGFHGVGFEANVIYGAMNP